MMDTEDLTRAMRAATDPVEARPSFAADVVRGGKRRQIRNRVTIAAAVVALMGVSAGAAITLRDSSALDLADAGEDVNPLLTGPTLGDLAGDQAFLDQAIEAWRTGLTTSPNKESHDRNMLEGTPRVHWAGTLPDGNRLAFVVQPYKPSMNSYAREDGTSSPVRKQTQAAIGVITGSAPTLVVEGTSGPTGSMPAFIVGTDPMRAVWLTDAAAPKVSPQWARTPDGTGSREWLPMTRLDSGLATVELPAGTPWSGVRVTAADPSDWGVPLAAASYSLGMGKQTKPMPTRSVDWPRNDPLRLAGANADSIAGDPMFDALTAAKMSDPNWTLAFTGFEVIAPLPNGRTAHGFELVGDPQGSRFFVAVRGADNAITNVYYGGAVDPKAALPAKVQLPDQQGWLVVSWGADLRYRTAVDGPWIVATKSAALLPANAIEVEITLDGQQRVQAL